ncbi:MAG: acyl-CoA dehydrogenase [Actinomycetia bacterium]|nr:acyl-CoA dehydrogenase [Actinomycetes bacterium]
MDLDLSPDQKLFRSTTKKFLESETPLERVRELAAAPQGFDRDWWERGAELGWAAMLVPDDPGAGRISGEGLLGLIVIAEEMGRMVAPGPLLPVNTVITALVESAGGPDHSAELDELASGALVAGWACDEPGTGWGTGPLRTVLTPVPGGFVLDGAKDRVEAAGQADRFLISAQSADGPAQVLVRAGTPGLSIEPSWSLDVVRRFGEVRLDGVQVGPEALVGQPGQAAAAMRRQNQVAAVLSCAETCGVAGRVLEFTVEWAFDRYSFGRPLASYQALKHRFADMKTWLEACHATTLAAARAVAAAAPDAAELASVAKSYVGSRATDIIQDCVQMHGGLGVTWEHDLHLYLRRATVNRALHGTPEEHRRRIADLMEA